VPQRETQAALGRLSGGGCGKAGMQKLESGHPKPGGMEETLEGGPGPLRAVALLERERISVCVHGGIVGTLDHRYKNIMVYFWVICHLNNAVI
jgi:hypothetical protein